MTNRLLVPSNNLSHRRNFAVVWLASLFFVTFGLCTLSFALVPDAASASAPSSVTVQTDEIYGTTRLVWSSVDGATGYLVYLNGSKITPSLILDTQLDASPFVASAGFYAFVVQAYSNRGVIACGTFSLDKRTVTATPARIRVENGTLAWDAVPNAAGYRVSVNGYPVYVGGATEYAIGKVCADDESYTVKLTALGDSLCSVDSAPACFTYSAEHSLPAPQNLYLALLNGKLTLSWTPSSDASSYYFEVYLASALLTNGYTDATLVDLGEDYDDGTYLVKVRQNGKKSALCEFSCKKYVVNGGVLNEIGL